MEVYKVVGIASAEVFRGNGAGDGGRFYDVEILIRLRMCKGVGVGGD